MVSDGDSFPDASGVQYLDSCVHAKILLSNICIDFWTNAIRRQLQERASPVCSTILCSGLCRMDNRDRMSCALLPFAIRVPLSIATSTSCPSKQSPDLVLLFRFD
jgi:hypothetical protein